jgi:hypothetical protein
MNTSLFKSLLVGSVAALLAVACGGGGGGGGGMVAGVGIGGSGITSVGLVTAVGSITVNGVKFDTQGAVVTVDGAGGQDSDLKVGLVTTVTGTLNSDGVTGTATRVDVDNELKGTLDSAPTITPTGGSFSVFGQLVLVDANTVFGNATGLADFSAGTAVEVSGFRDASGQVRATRVEKEAPAPATIEVKGAIITVNSGASTFTLGTLTVSFAGAQQINFPAGGLSTGLLVEVKGPQPSAGALAATSVEVKSGELGPVSGEVRLEGFMNGLAGSAPNFSFSVNGQNVTTNTTTAYDNGTSANLANNNRVEVEGQISGGVLLATKVKFEEKNNDVRITAQVTVKSTTATAFTVFANPGVSVTTDASTVFQDKSSIQSRIFGFANVQVNDWLQIEAATVAGSAASVAATKVVRIDPPSNLSSILQGPVDSATRVPDISILGVVGVTQPATIFLDANGNALIQATFFSQMTTTANTIVKMSGIFDGRQIASVLDAQLED